MLDILVGMSMNLTNPKNNEVINSIFASDAEAKDALFSKITNLEFSDPSFAQKLVVAFHNGNLSPAMQFWLHKLAQPKQAPKAVTTILMDGIVNLFAKASEKLKRPAVVLAAGDGTKVKISLAGSNSKYTGSVMVSSPSFGGAYYGRITEGAFFAGRDNKPVVFDLLKSFSENPAEVAAQHGHATGCCCFCNKALTDERSTKVGYGPVCAGKYGLAW
jgi:hypothetical protein